MAQTTWTIRRVSRLLAAGGLVLALAALSGCYYAYPGYDPYTGYYYAPGCYYDYPGWYYGRPYHAYPAFNSTFVFGGYGGPAYYGGGYHGGHYHGGHHGHY